MTNVCTLICISCTNANKQAESNIGMWKSLKIVRCCMIISFNWLKVFLGTKCYLSIALFLAKSSIVIGWGMNYTSSVFPVMIVTFSTSEIPISRGL